MAVRHTHTLQGKVFKKEWIVLFSSKLKIPVAAVAAAVFLLAAGCASGAPVTASVSPSVMAEVTPASSPPSGAFAASTGNIHDYLPDLIAGKPVSAYALLPCFESFSHATWLELEKTYGGPDSTGWWNPLLSALNDGAVGDGQEMRDYYLGRAFLTADGAYSEGLEGALYAQWTADSTVYNACLSGRFSAGEAAALRQAIVFSIASGGSNFGLMIPGNNCAVFLDKYPVDFPFGFDFIEKSRSSFKAESFGQTEAVESEGLQVTYLHNTDGVYLITILRTVSQGASALGVAVGDKADALKEVKTDPPLKKSDGLSYDDEAWFGKCDDVYVYAPDIGTKSIVFLVTGNTVTGIELVNGLDGKMY